MLLWKKFFKNWGFTTFNCFFFDRLFLSGLLHLESLEISMVQEKWIKNIFQRELLFVRCPLVGHKTFLMFLKTYAIGFINQQHIMKRYSLFIKRHIRNWQECGLNSQRQFKLVVYLGCFSKSKDEITTIW